MKQFTVSHTFLLSLATARLTSATFSLEEQCADWSYTTKDLAPTTSQKCKDAYSANIDCDSSVLRLVTSSQSLFKRTSVDLDTVCTDTCKASIDAYIQNVKEECAAEGDKAQEYSEGLWKRGGGHSNKYYLHPVETIGLLFQYTVAWDCAKNGNGGWCYGVKHDFNCDDPCAMSYYKAANDCSVSNLQFSSSHLVSKDSKWIDTFKSGWDKFKKCSTTATPLPAQPSTSKEILTQTISEIVPSLTPTAETTPCLCSSGDSATIVIPPATTETPSVSLSTESSTFSTSVPVPLTPTSLPPTSATSSSSPPIVTSNKGSYLESSSIFMYAVSCIVVLFASVAV